MRKTILGALSMMAGAAMMTTAAKAECGDVTITEMNWASAAVVTEVAKFLMEQGYGCKVTKVPSATQTAAASLVETGKPDIATELWLNGLSGVQKLIDEGKAVDLGRVLSDGGVEGWYVPKYMVDKNPELATIDGVLKNAKLLGGRFHQCPEGWSCKIATGSLIKAFELEKNGFEIFVHGSGETLATSIASAYANKEPWIGYYWEPTDVLGKYEMVRVDLGPVNEEIHKCNADKDCDAVGKSQWPASPVATIVTKDFASKNPEVTELLKNVSFANETMNAVLAWKKDNKASGEEAAVYYLNNHKDEWSTWINDDAKKNLSELLK